MRTLVAWLGDRRVACVLCLAGWATYISLVTASNLTELMHSFGWVSWTFRSGNLDFIGTATKIYVSSRAVNQVLLAGVIAWEGLSAVLFWRATVRYASAQRDGLPAARAALVLLGSLWFAFAIATELFVAYDRGINESSYWTLATAILATLVVLHVVGPAADLPSQGRT
jgi:hypothetical protein